MKETFVEVHETIPVLVDYVQVEVTETEEDDEDNED